MGLIVFLDKNSKTYISYIRNVIFFLSLLTLLLFQFSQGVFASATVRTGNVQVSARVGEFSLDISGIASPYASVILSSDDVFLASTVADASGVFSFSQVAIQKGFSHFCFDVIDVKRLGDSYTCFSVSPANGNINMHDLFLPPTAGFFSSQIATGSNLIVFGYSMPDAAVTIHVISGKEYTTIASKTGYYEIHIPVSQIGVYELYPDALYQHRNSLKPTRNKRFEVVTPLQSFFSLIDIFIQKLIHLLLTVPILLILPIIPIIILIIILLRKLRPQWFWFTKKQKEKKLHHFWFEGVGY